MKLQAQVLGYVQGHPRGRHAGERSGRKPPPRTSYGYQPPPGATAHGWKCTNRDCGHAEHEPVRRWPDRCAACGWPVDPLLDEPWAHEAEGVELDWEIRHHPERSGGFTQERLMDWRLKDALLRGDPVRARQARATIRSYADKQVRQERWWSPSRVLMSPVLDALAAGDIDGAARDLCFWLSISSGDDAGKDNRNRTNSRAVIEAAAKFLAAPGGASHPRAPEIRHGCLYVAEGAFMVLDRDLQAAVNQMAWA